MYYVNSKWKLKIAVQDLSFWSLLCYKIINITGKNLLVKENCFSIFYQNKNNKKGYQTHSAPMQ